MDDIDFEYDTDPGLIMVGMLTAGLTQNILSGTNTGLRKEKLIAFSSWNQARHCSRLLG